MFYTLSLPVPLAFFLFLFFYQYCWFFTSTDIILACVKSFPLMTSLLAMCGFYIFHITLPMCCIFWFYLLNCLNEIVPVFHFEMLR